MILAVCVDNRLGMAFNQRRQSQDRKMREALLAGSGGRKIWTDTYSAAQFEEEQQARLTIDDQWPKRIGRGEIGFAERDLAGIDGANIEEIWLYRWNREYPADQWLSLDLSKWRCTTSRDFAGYSHERITEERYVR